MAERIEFEKVEKDAILKKIHISEMRVIEKEKCSYTLNEEGLTIHLGNGVTPDNPAIMKLKLKDKYYVGKLLIHAEYSASISPERIAHIVFFGTKTAYEIDLGDNDRKELAIEDVGDTLVILAYGTPNEHVNINISLVVSQMGETLKTDIEEVKNALEKITPVASLYNADKTVGTEAVRIDTDTLVREDVTILADINNTDTVYIGNAEVQKFPLEPGAALTLRKVRLADIYAVSNTDNQIIHVISGGGYDVGGGYYE